VERVARPHYKDAGRVLQDSTFEMLRTVPGTSDGDDSDGHYDVVLVMMMMVMARC
jgi:hypothetical protein